MTTKTLVVDDSKTMRLLIKKILLATEYDMDILEAEDGIKALRQIEDNEVDIVFTDVNMPNMNKPTPIVKSIEITLEQAYTGLNYPLKIEKWVMEENIKKMEQETIYVDIKAGIDDSEIIILRNRGNMISDTNIGDIKLFIKVMNNTEFVRDGLDLLLTKNITLKEALIGFQFDFKHLSGKTYTINNKPGKVVTPDFVKEVANMGMKRTRPHPASPLVGNLLICFNIKYPTTITEEQCKQLAEIL